MGRLRSVGSILLLLFGLLVATAAGLLYLWADENQWRIAFAEKEIQGARYLDAIERVRQTYASHLVGGPESDVQQALTDAQAADSEFGPFGESTGLSRKLAATYLQRPRSDALLQALSDLNNEVGDQSNLILDPDLDSYYLMDLVLLRVPEGYDQGYRLSRGEKVSKSMLEAQGALLEAHLESVRRSVAAAVRNLRIKEGIGDLQRAEASYVATNRQLVEALKRGEQPKNLVFQSQRTRAKFYATASRLLQDVLEVRRSELATRRNSILTSSVTAMALLFFLAAAVIRRIQTTLAGTTQRLGTLSSRDFVALEQGIARLSQGTLTGDLAPSAAAPLSVPTLTELADLAKSYNQLQVGVNQAIDSLNIARSEFELAKTAAVTTEQRFKTVVDSLGEGIIITDLHDHIIYANNRMLSMLNVTESNLLGEPGNRTLFLAADQTQAGARTQQRYSGVSESYESRIRRSDGSWFWAEIHAVPFRDQNGVIVGTLGAVADISERKDFESQLKHEAFHDALTGLPNRALFLDRLEQAHGRYRRQNRDYAILFLDLDNFKMVNDSLGHEAGDILLRTVADRLAKVTRETDTVARLGGDEFTILLEDFDSRDHAEIVARRVQDEFSAPVRLEEHSVSVSASIGIAFGEKDVVEVGEMLRNADAAMYEAKSGGKRRSAVFDESMITRAKEWLRLETDLRIAIDQNGLSLNFQPIVDLQTSRITEVEALCRWDHPTLGSIAPVRFIPLAEEAGLILDLGLWVLRESCRQARTWSDDPHDGPAVSVNISQHQIRHQNLMEVVQTALRDFDLPPQRLKLEITESAMMHDPAHVASVLRRLQAIGVRLSIDDFGTGYSSMAHLRDLPLDSLKIDRSFVSRLDSGSDEDRAIIRAILGLGKTLKLQVVSEGIETEQQREFLANEGCESGQGYLFAKPVSASQLRDLLSGREFERDAA